MTNRLVRFFLFHFNTYYHLRSLEFKYQYNGILSIFKEYFIAALIALVYRVARPNGRAILRFKP